MVFSNVRNYFHELRTLVPTEWKFFQKFGITAPDPESPDPDIDLRRLQTGYRQRDIENQLLDDYHNNYDDRINGLKLRDQQSDEPFEFFEPLTTPTPDSRIPQPGLHQLPYRFHNFDQDKGNPNDPLDEERFIFPQLRFLLDYKYPQYWKAVNSYTRPVPTVDRTFSDFNKQQIEYPPIEHNLARKINTIVTFLLNAKPFLPLHWIDTFFTKLPLVTGTSYFYRYSYDQRTHAASSHPDEYASRTTSNGYFFNSFSEFARTVVHRIKQFALPFDPTNLSPIEKTEKLKTFLLEHATMLFTRSQISKILGPFKVRPVYAVDRLFIQLECMITFPLHMMARSLDSAMMYSIETVRGGCAYLDILSRQYKSYLCLDWSTFDQRMPWIIVDFFFTMFLPSLIIISDGYAPTSEYPSYPDLTPDTLFQRIFNIICFLRLWYYNMVFVLADGYSYVRKFCGIASGMLNTQYLDSYCNLFLMIHGLLHFGCTDDEILAICYFVMGDDNVLLTDWPLERLQEFLIFFEQHALSRFGMVLSTQKTIITRIRTRIEILGYQINSGKPRRNLDKLIAQLVFPERGPKLRYMSSRAIGMTWAAAGMDPMFHRFCEDVYYTFKPFEDFDDASPDTRRLPGYIAYVLAYGLIDDLNITKFPTIDEVQQRYAWYQGELETSKKWSPAHFTHSFDYLPPSSTTVEMMMSRKDIVFPDVPRLFD